MLMNFVLVALGNLGKKRILTHTGIVLPKTHTANQVLNAKNIRLGFFVCFLI